MNKLCIKEEKNLTRKKLLPILLVYGAVIMLALLGRILSDGFLTANNISNILRATAFMGIAAIGQTIVILTGGIDLSIQYTLVLCNAVSAQIMNGSNGNLVPALLVCLGICLTIGIINGAGVYYLNVPPMIMTLAVGTMVYGIAYIYCKGAPKGYASPALITIANEKLSNFFPEGSLFRFLNINGMIVIWVLLSILTILILKKTVFGRTIYAIGANRVCARFSGINVPFTLIGVYVISSILAGLTGIMFVGYTGTSFLSTGQTYNMDTIAAVVVGGTSITGGVGGYFGTIAGVLVIRLILNVLTIMSAPESVKQIINGLILIVLLVSIYRRKTNKKSKNEEIKEAVSVAAKEPPAEEQ